MTFSAEYLRDLETGARKTGDGKVVVSINPDVRVYPCEGTAWLDAHDKARNGMFGYWQTEPTTGVKVWIEPEREHFHEAVPA